MLQFYLKSGNILLCTVFSCKKFVWKFHSWEKLATPLMKWFILMMKLGKKLSVRIHYTLQSKLLVFGIINYSLPSNWCSEKSNFVWCHIWLFNYQKMNTSTLCQTFFHFLKKLNVLHICKNGKNWFTLIAVKISDTSPIWFQLFATSQNCSSLQ